MGSMGPHGAPLGPHGAPLALWAYLGPILPVDSRAGQRVSAVYISFADYRT
jgi:hypothetical protein